MTTDIKEFAGVLLLTDREYEMFKAIGQGLTPREIAAIKGHRILSSSVHKYYERLADKLGTENWRQTFRLAVRYECLRLKRIAIVPAQPQYKFVADTDLEEAPIPVLPASRNGHRLLAERPETLTKGTV